MTESQRSNNYTQLFSSLVLTNCIVFTGCIPFHNLFLSTFYLYRDSLRETEKQNEREKEMENAPGRNQTWAPALALT